MAGDRRRKKRIRRIRRRRITKKREREMLEKLLCSRTRTAGRKRRKKRIRRRRRRRRRITSKKPSLSSSSRRGITVIIIIITDGANGAKKKWKMLLCSTDEICAILSVPLSNLAAQKRTHATLRRSGLTQPCEDATLRRSGLTQPCEEADSRNLAAQKITQVPSAKAGKCLCGISEESVHTTSSPSSNSGRGRTDGGQTHPKIVIIISSQSHAPLHRNCTEQLTRMSPLNHG